MEDLSKLTEGELIRKLKTIESEFSIIQDFRNSIAEINDSFDTKLNMDGLFKDITGNPISLPVSLEEEQKAVLNILQARGISKEEIDSKIKLLKI